MSEKVEKDEGGTEKGYYNNWRFCQSGKHFPGKQFYGRYNLCDECLAMLAARKQEGK